MNTQAAEGRTVSLYPDQWQAIEDYAVELGLRGLQTRSTALQHILDEWMGSYPRGNGAQHAPAVIARSPLALETA